MFNHWAFTFLTCSILVFSFLSIYYSDVLTFLIYSELFWALSVVVFFFVAALVDSSFIVVLSFIILLVATLELVFFGILITLRSR